MVLGSQLVLQSSGECKIEFLGKKPYLIMLLKFHLKLCA